MPKEQTHHLALGVASKLLVLGFLQQNHPSFGPLRPSAPTWTVTTWRGSTAMSRWGSVGCLHRPQKCPASFPGANRRGVRTSLLEQPAQCDGCFHSSFGTIFRDGHPHSIRNIGIDDKEKQARCRSPQYALTRESRRQLRQRRQIPSLLDQGRQGYGDKLGGLASHTNLTSFLALHALLERQQGNMPVVETWDSCVFLLFLLLFVVSGSKSLSTLA